MDPERRKKIRRTVKKISAAMKNDPNLRRQVAQNPIRVLRDRGGLDLDEIIEAHDMFNEGNTLGQYCCPALTMSG
jgi:hypothetical protein